MRPRFIKQAALFYGALILAATLWNAYRGREPLDPGSIRAGVPLGVATACVTVALGLGVYRLLPVMRRIADEIAPVLVDGTRSRDLVLISVLSGVGEEALFRGALQPEIGLVLTALIFGVVHIGPDRRYLVWTAWALFAGFLFGVLYDITGGILAPVLAHSLHNTATFLIWKRSRARIVKGENL